MLAGWVRRDHRLYSPFRQPIPQAIGIVGPVSEQSPGRRDCRQQIARGRQIMAIAGRDQKGDRAATILGQRVDFCRAAAARAAYRVVEVPPFAPPAERWALMCALSIDIVPIRPVEPVRA